MKKNSNIIFSISTLVLSFPIYAFAAPDMFPAFESNAFLKENGSILVSEEFIYDFGNTPKHGVIRTIPLVSEDSKRWFELGNISIKDKNKNDIKFEAKTSGNIATLKIGDPDITLKDTQYYNLRYSVNNIASNNDISWKVAPAIKDVIEKLRATLYFPVLIPFETATATCRIIPERQGSESCKILPLIKSGKLAGFQADLSNVSKEEVYLDIKYPGGVVVSSYVEKEKFKLPISYTELFFIVILISAAFIGIKYRKIIKEKIDFVRKQAEHPETFSYLERAMYFNSEIKKEDVIATIVDLADREFLTLTPIPRPVGNDEFVDYGIEVNTSDIDNVPEKIILESLVQNSKPLSIWLSEDFENLKAMLQTETSISIKYVKMYKDKSELPTLIGFKVI